MANMKHKIVQITGAGGGTGRQLAYALAARGAIIAAVDINPLGLEETVANIRQQEGRVKDYLFDTAKRLPVVALVDEVLDDWGRIDILIIAAEVRPSDPILTMDEWEFHRTLDVNLAGPFFLMQRVGQAMIHQGGGMMVIAGGEVETQNIASVQAQNNPSVRAQDNAPDPGGGAAYQITQAGLAALAHAAQREFAAYNIKVMGIEDFRARILD